MSVKAMTQVWELKLRAPHQQLLLAMADHADDEGVCWPSIDRMAWKSGMSRSTVIRHLQVLKSAGLLEVVKEATRRSPVIYKICIDRGEKKAPYGKREGLQSDTSVAPVSGSGSVGSGVSNGTIRGVTAMTP